MGPRMGLGDVGRSLGHSKDSSEGPCNLFDSLLLPARFRECSGHPEVDLGQRPSRGLSRPHLGLGLGRSRCRWGLGFLDQGRKGLVLLTCLRQVVLEAVVLCLG